MTNSQHAYEVRRRKDKRGFDLISEAVPFGRLWYTNAAGKWERVFGRDVGQSAVLHNPYVEKSKSNTWFIAGLVGLATVFVIGISACDKQTETTTTDPTDPRYWTPERIALSRASADAAAHGKVLIGMSAAYCQQAWGKPEKVDRTTTANRVSEWWWYGGGRALHLENGFLVAIHE